MASMPSKARSSMPSTPSPACPRAIVLWRESGTPGARKLAWAAFTGVLAACCSIGLLATSGWLITRASLEPPVLSLSIAIGAVQAFALGRGIARYMQRLAVHDVALSTLGKLRLFVYDKLEVLVPGKLGKNRSGRVLSAFVTDCETAVDALAKGLGAAIDLASTATLGLVLAWLIDPRACAALAVGILLVALVAVGSTRLGRSAAVAEAETCSELADAVVETVRSAPELLVYGRHDLVVTQLDRARSRGWSAASRRAAAVGLGRAAVTICSAATLVGVVATGLADHDAHRLSAVVLAVLVFTTLATLEVGNGLPDTLFGVSKGDAATRRLLGLCDTDSSERARDAFHSRDRCHPGDLLRQDKCHPGERSGTSRAPAPPETGLENASVSASDGSLLLCDVTLGTRVDRRLAVVGCSGSGKTTATHAILGFVDCASGRAFVGGADVRTLSRSALARRIGWLPEETHIFTRSLAANLRVADPVATDEECLEVLGTVGLGEWCCSLPEGLSTRLGAGGRTLSAGERQRIGMARALLACGRAVVLDEPTAHLDPASAVDLLPDLLEAAGHRAVIVTSHDAGIAPHVDEVVTLSAGRVVG